MFNFKHKAVSKCNFVSHIRRHCIAAPCPFCDWFPISGKNLVHGVHAA